MMKKLTSVAQILVVLFCIDYSITILLGFELIYARVIEAGALAKVYAFVIGACGFLAMLGMGKQED